MSETVFIIGAGASKHAGAPLMGNFLDAADEIRKKGSGGEYQPDLDLVFKARNALQLSHSKSQVDLDNLESVFAAFEMASLLGRLGELLPEEAGRLPSAMKRLILKTLETTIHFPAPQGKPTPTADYDKFVRLIYNFSEKNGTGDLKRISIISLNYDVCLDLALTFHRIPFDYCLGEKSGEPAVRLLKLHGSLNWARCPGCQATVPWKVHQYLNNRMWNSFGGSEKVTVSIGSKIREFIHCGEEAPKEPFLVPPTWNKGQHYADVGLVWRAAAAQLRDAENIFVCGYSLPKTDHFFQLLYALGSVGEARFKKFWVFNPDSSVEQNFRDILGPSALHRFQFFPDLFASAIDRIREVLLKG